MGGKASIEKNLSLAHFAISSLDQQPPLEVAERKRDAIKFMISALKRAKSGATKKDATWMRKAEELADKIIASGVEKVADLARETAAEKYGKDATDEKMDMSQDDNVSSSSSSESLSSAGSSNGKRKDAGKVNAQHVKKSSSSAKAEVVEISARVWVRFFYIMIEPVEPKTRLVEPYMSFAKQLFGYAVKAREKCDFKEALYYFDEMAFPLGEAERLSKATSSAGPPPPDNTSNGCSTSNNNNNNNEGDAAFENCLDPVQVESEVRVTREEVTMEKSIAGSMSAIQQGGELFTIAVLNEESPNMNLIFEAMDWFKNAALKARGLDLEQEAIACHHIGRIFERVIKLKGRAKEYYMQVLRGDRCGSDGVLFQIYSSLY